MPPRNFKPLPSALGPLRPAAPSRQLRPRHPTESPAPPPPPSSQHSQSQHSQNSQNSQDSSKINVTSSQDSLEINITSSGESPAPFKQGPTSTPDPLPATLGDPHVPPSLEDAFDDAAGTLHTTQTVTTGVTKNEQAGEPAIDPMDVDDPMDVIDFDSFLAEPTLAGPPPNWPAAPKVTKGKYKSLLALTRSLSISACSSGSEYHLGSGSEDEDPSDSEWESDDSSGAGPSRAPGPLSKHQARSRDSGPSTSTPLQPSSGSTSTTSRPIATTTQQQTVLTNLPNSQLTVKTSTFIGDDGKNYVILKDAEESRRLVELAWIEERSLNPRFVLALPRVSVEHFRISMKEFQERKAVWLKKMS